MDERHYLTVIAARLKNLGDFVTSPRFPTDVHQIAHVVAELHGVLTDIIAGAMEPEDRAAPEDNAHG
jgi:hypothetical protein